MLSRLAFGLILVFVFSGCQRVSRVRECKRLSGLANPKLDQVEALAKNGRASDYRAAAATYIGLGKELRKSPTISDTSKALVDEYASVIESVAPAASAYALALDGKDAPKLEEARRSLERLTKHERGVVARLDAYCLAP